VAAGWALLDHFYQRFFPVATLVFLVNCRILPEAERMVAVLAEKRQIFNEGRHGSGYRPN
jgi:hypothetical protein